MCAATLCVRQAGGLHGSVFASIVDRLARCAAMQPGRLSFLLRTLSAISAQTCRCSTQASASSYAFLVCPHPRQSLIACSKQACLRRIGWQPRAVVCTLYHLLTSPDIHHICPRYIRLEHIALLAANSLQITLHAAGRCLRGGQGCECGAFHAHHRRAARGRRVCNGNGLRRFHDRRGGRRQRAAG